MFDNGIFLIRNNAHNIFTRITNVDANAIAKSIKHKAPLGALQTSHMIIL